MKYLIQSLFKAYFYVSLCVLKADAFAPSRGVSLDPYPQTLSKFPSTCKGSHFPFNKDRYGAMSDLRKLQEKSIRKDKFIRSFALASRFSSQSFESVLSSLFRYDGQVPFVQAMAINVLLFAVFRGKLLSALTPSGFIHAMALGTMLWTTMGWRGWSYCVMYLVLGQAVTKVRFADKVKRGIAESRGGRRGPENVWGSAATSLLCAVGSAQGVMVAPFLQLSPELYVLGFVAGLATKLADTFASEIGKAYGKTTFLITSFKRVEPGTEGAVSAEGTVAAAVGGFILSMVGYSIGLIDLPSVAVSTASAFIATNVESLIGATLQGKEGFSFMTNEVVNFVNTLIGATIAIASGTFLLGIA